MSVTVRLEEAARMFVTSLEYIVLNWRVLDTVTVEDQRSYVKIETLRGKNPADIHIALHEVSGGP
jgi:hypothetical protein